MIEESVNCVGCWKWLILSYSTVQGTRHRVILKGMFKRIKVCNLTELLRRNLDNVAFRSIFRYNRAQQKLALRLRAFRSSPEGDGNAPTNWLPTAIKNQKKKKKGRKERKEKEDAGTVEVGGEQPQS